MADAFFLQQLLRTNRGPSAIKIDASRNFALPGVDCPSCTPWAWTGLQYPCADIQPLREQIGNLDPGRFRLRHSKC
jgi:Protein of unknown function (Gmx_para_CXXCG)